VTLTPEQQALVQAQIAEATKKANAEAAAARVKLKELKDAEEAKIAEQQKAQGQFKELYEKTKAELDSAKPLLETLEAKYATLEASRKGELLARLPQDKRESYKDFPLDILEKIATDFGGNASAPANSLGSVSGSQPSVTGANATFDALTDEQREQLLKTNPSLFDKMLNEHLRKQYLGAT
jgi:PAB1-binding protein PBP1